MGTTEPFNKVRNQGTAQKPCPAEDGDIAGHGIRTFLTALCDTTTGIYDAHGKSNGDVTISKEQVRSGGPGEVLGPPEIHSPETTDLDTLQKQKTKHKTELQRDLKKKWGGSIKRGCLAQFTVKTILYLPHVSEITIIQDKHVNCDGLVVHGGMKLGDISAFSAHLSPEIRSFVEGLFA